MIVVNAAFPWAPWADVIYMADYRCWKEYIDDIRSTCDSEWWTVSEQARDEFGAYWIRHVDGVGFRDEPDAINGGGNSGYQGIHLAATFGASRIVLLGFDMQRTGGKLHCHGPHRGRLPNGKGFPRWIKAMTPLARDLRDMGVEVINCSRATALRCFPCRSIEEVMP